jgi:methionyl-tRNA formyltransferase
VRIIFAGTPAFALPTLEALHTGEHDVVAVYTQPDRPAGRGHKLHVGPIKQFALAHRLPIRQPAALRDEVQALTALDPDVIVVVAYGLLLPPTVLTIPKHGCINVHASLLPRWRGAAPIARAIEAGDSETGVTIMQMEAGLDTGPMLLRRYTPIADTDTTASVEARLARLGADALVAVLDASARGDVRPEPQDNELACYAPKLQKSEAPIDWSQPACQLHRKIRAFNPWPVASTTYRGDVLRVWDVGPLADDVGAARLPGTIVGVDAESLRVQAGEGVLTITRLQAAGGRPLAVREFVNGTPLRLDDRLGT